MSDIFQNFGSNGLADNSQDIQMASPTQSSPLANSNSNSNMATSMNSQNGAGSSGTTKVPATESQPILTKPRLLELVREVDVSIQLDEDVEEILLQIADDFVDDCIKSSVAIAKHRKANKVEVRDCQLHLERKYNMWIPGFGTDELRPYKRAAITEAHKQRLALIRKTIKKY